MAQPRRNVHEDDEDIYRLLRELRSVRNEDLCESDETEERMMDATIVRADWQDDLIRAASASADKAVRDYARREPACEEAGEKEQRSAPPSFVAYNNDFADRRLRHATHRPAPVKQAEDDELPPDAEDDTPEEEAAPERRGKKRRGCGCAVIVVLVLLVLVLAAAVILLLSGTWNPETVSGAIQALAEKIKIWISELGKQ